jgi:hypothetical protein
MKSLISDPVFLISGGILIAGLIAFFWAVGKFRRLAVEGMVSDSTDDLLPAAPDLPDIDFRAPVQQTRTSTFVPAPAPTSTVSKDVAERLESMTQRLSEMQTVLLKQSAAASTAAPGGAPSGVGQGFSPETIDKLLKIIGNVIQQVDILQKSTNVPK